MVGGDGGGKSRKSSSPCAWKQHEGKGMWVKACVTCESHTVFRQLIFLCSSCWAQSKSPSVSPQWVQVVDNPPAQTRALLLQVLRGRGRQAIRIAQLLCTEQHLFNFALALSDHITCSSSLLRKAMAYSLPQKSLEAAGSNAWPSGGSCHPK